mgnify:CR=1 FL=1
MKEVEKLQVFLKTFQLLSKAYLDQQVLPSSLIRRLIAYHENQKGADEKDPSLAYADISLFGLHSPKQWFGKNYIQSAAAVIMNGAAKAKKQGISIPSQSIRQDLIEQTRQAASIVSREMDPKTDFYQLFLQQVRRMGMTEQECIEVWKDIALFRKLHKEVMSSFQVTEADFPELKTVNREKAVVEKFSLPPSLECRDFLSLARLCLYIDLVGSSQDKTKEKALSFPREFLSLAEIERKVPDLIQRDYEFEYAEIDIKQAASQIGLKSMWQWQTLESSFDLLKKQFPILADAKKKTEEERWLSLEAIDPKIRKEIDKWSREKMLSLDLARVKEMLAQEEKEVKVLSLTSTGLELPFKEIKDPKALMALFQVAEIPSSKESSLAAVKAKESLSFYTEDGQRYYSISLLKRSPEPKVQTFAEATASGALRRLLDKKLENLYRRKLLQNFSLSVIILKL